MSNPPRDLVPTSGRLPMPIPRDGVVGPRAGLEEFDLHAVGSFLKRRRATILSSLVTVVVAVTLLTLLWPPTYESRVSILVKPVDREGGGIPGLAVLERLERSTALETEMELIRSRRVIEPVVDELDLHVRARENGDEAWNHVIRSGLEADAKAVPGKYLVEAESGTGFVVRDDNGGRTIARGAPGSTLAFSGVSLNLPDDPEGEITLEIDPFSRAVAKTRKQVVVSLANQDGDLLEVVCQGRTAEGALGLCEAVSAYYVDLKRDLQRSEATVTAEFLRGQVSDYARRLAVAEDSLKVFKREEQAVALVEQASEEVRQYAGIKARRDAVDAERRALSSVIGRIEGSNGGDERYRELASFPAFLGNQTIADLMNSLTQLETRRSDLSQRRTKQNPELAALDRRISAIDRQLRDLAVSYERSLASEVRSLDRVVGGSLSRLERYPERQVEAARLEREVTSLGVLYNLLETRLREAEVAVAVDQPNVRVVDVASVPLEPSSPRPLLNLALAIVLGLGFGLALAMIREHGDARIHDRRALRHTTDLPVLAMLPAVGRGGPLHAFDLVRLDLDTRRPQVTGKRHERLSVPAPRGRPLGSGRIRIRRNGEVGANGKQMAIEAFRSLGTDLRFVASALQTGDLRSVAITSPGRGDGKTFTACNLALTRAGFGIDTLLVDADMRGGGIARFFDLESPSPGLTDLLAGNSTAREARRIIRVNEVDSLSVIPAGIPTPLAAELLETSYFGAMLSGAQAVYDLVIIDTPPLNVLADAAAVATCVDAVLVVVREGQTDEFALELTLERLRRSGGTVVGIVLNDVTLPKQFADGSYTYA